MKWNFIRSVKSYVSMTNFCCQGEMLFFSGMWEVLTREAKSEIRSQRLLNIPPTNWRFSSLKQGRMGCAITFPTYEQFYCKLQKPGLKTLVDDRWWQGWTAENQGILSSVIITKVGRFHPSAHCWMKMPLYCLLKLFCHHQMSKLKCYLLYIKFL